jgi:four helix bundle protein
MNRAAMSIPTNVVEGTGQRSRRDYARFVRFAVNSASELEYHLMTARDLGTINRADFDSLSSQTIEVRKMLHGLIRTLIKSEQSTTKSGSPAAGVPRQEVRTGKSRRSTLNPDT